MRHAMRRDEPDWLQRCLRRARPLLGTTVILQLEPTDGGDPISQRSVHAAADAAFGAIAHVGAVMSAHHPASDLGRLARVARGAVLALDPHTVCVLRAAQRWQRASRGAFDPVQAARTLCALGLRPAFSACATADGSLQALRFEDERHVHVDAPLRLDLGGIGKGYAVDLAVATLQRHGVASGLVNAGGDLRAFGPRSWPVRVVSRGSRPSLRRATSNAGAVLPPRSLESAALATSQSAHGFSEFVATARVVGAARWPAQRCCAVRAPDCMTADALTKWALQSRPASTRLARALREQRALLWRL